MKVFGLEEKRHRLQQRINRKHSQLITTVTNRKDRDRKRREIKKILIPIYTPLESTSSPQLTPEIKIDIIITEI